MLESSVGGTDDNEALSAVQNRGSDEVGGYGTTSPIFFQVWPIVEAEVLDVDKNLTFMSQMFEYSIYEN